MADSSQSNPLRTVDGGCELQVIVLPRSSQNCIVGFQDTALKVKVSKPPVDGRANEACCRLIADLFSLPLSRVTVVRGHFSRRKTIRCERLDTDTARAALEPWVKG